LAKSVVEDALQLDILYFQQNRLLSWAPDIVHNLNWHRGEKVISSIGFTLLGEQGRPHSIRLNYDAFLGQDKYPCGYTVTLVPTSCNYGGVRWWFICPGWRGGIECRRRCRILYLPSGAIYFVCRRCHELTYDSTRKTGSLFYELIERPMKIRDKSMVALQHSRSPRRQTRALQRIRWAERVLTSGFLRLPSTRILQLRLASGETRGLGRQGRWA